MLYIFGKPFGECLPLPSAGTACAPEQQVRNTAGQWTSSRSRSPVTMYMRKRRSLFRLLDGTSALPPLPPLLLRPMIPVGLFGHLLSATLAPPRPS